MRAVVDTNVWICGLLNPAGPPARIIAALEAARFELVTSEPLLDELADVTARPRLVSRLNLLEATGARLVAFLREQSVSVPVTGDLRVCRDPKDDMVIETAINGSADVLVSRDDDLKRSPEVAGVLIEHGVGVVTVQRFLNALEEESAGAVSVRGA